MGTRDLAVAVVQLAARTTVCLGLLAAPSVAQISGGPAAYPSQPVRVLVGFTAGSGPDVLARTVVAQLSQALKQQSAGASDAHHASAHFYVENQSGANGTLAINTLVKAEPNGHTLLYSSSSITPIPYIYKTVRFDIVRDLVPIATVGVLDGLLMLVHPATPVRNVPELIAYAKQNRLVYGSPGVGNALHLATELFNLKAGVTIDHVPFRGTGDVTTALLSQTIHVMLVTPPSVLGLAKDGQLRAIGFTGSKPFPEFPDLALLKDVVPGYPVIGSWGMFFAPVGTPPPIIEKLNAAIRTALHAPAVANVVLQAGYVPDERSPAAAAEFFKREVEAAVEAVAAARIKPN